VKIDKEQKEYYVSRKIMTFANLYRVRNKKIFNKILPVAYRDYHIGSNLNIPDGNDTIRISQQWSMAGLQSYYDSLEQHLHDRIRYGQKAMLDP
jgi:hypothetical protein